MTDLPEALRSKINRLPLAYLRDKSAHSDIGAMLLDAVKPLGDVQIHCPDWQSYRYVAVSTNNIIFGFAAGMDTVAFRLDSRMRERAIATGGAPVPECGEEWVAVLSHRSDSDWPAVDVKFWAGKAYAYARG